MRPKLPERTEAALLLRCRRRCAICYGLSRDSDEKRGQIAHLDRDSSNNAPDNLVFLCLEHHDVYDSQTSQSKRLTKSEVKVFKAELEDAVTAALAAPIVLNRSSLSGSNTGLAEWEGVYRAEQGEAAAELSIRRSTQGQYSVSGLAFYGVSREFGPNLGELEAEGHVEGDCLVVTKADYTLRLRRISLGLQGEESFAVVPFGLGVSFALAFHKVPRGGEAVPQASREVFESEFWPEEGVPEYLAKVNRLTLHSRPTVEAPVVGEWAIGAGAKVPFDGFRYRTLRPGTLVAQQDGELTGRNLGKTGYVSVANYYRDGGEEVRIRYRLGDEVEYLQYRAEGTAFLRWNGLVLDADLPTNVTFKLSSHPVAEGWVRVSVPGEATSGWVLVDEQLEEATREF